MVEVPSFDLSPDQLAYIGEVGAALFQGRSLQASRNGLISVMPIVEAHGEKGEENEQRQGTRRPTTESRERRQGPSSAAHHTGPVFDRLRYRGQVHGLNEAYPGTRAWCQTDGLWLAIPAHPIGEEGPRATHFVAIPKHRKARIVSWAFWGTGSQAEWIGHRHTNYPDGSVCAFPAQGGFWRDGDPLIDYVDRLSEWTLRQLYYSVHRRWPGSQEGPSAYYRRLETRPGECCPRCGSLKRYEHCCRSLDELDEHPDDRAEFIRRFKCDVGRQRPHDRVILFAKGERKRPPRMARVHFDLRPDWDWRK